MGIVSPYILPAEIRPSMGIAFRPQSKAFIPTSGKATVLLYIELPEIQTPSINICSLQTLQNDSVCGIELPPDLFKLQTMVNNIQSKIMIKNNDLTHMIKAMDVTQIRVRKALFGFISQLSKQLFGTATTDDVAKIYNHIKKLKKAIEKTSTDTNILSTQMNHLADKLDSKIVQITHAVNWTATATRDLIGNVKQLQQNMHHMIAHELERFQVYQNSFRLIKVRHYLLTMMVTFEALAQQITDWTSGLLILNKGFLPHSLVPLHVLRESLFKLKRWAKNNNEQFDIYTDVAHAQMYYEIANSQGFVIDKTLIITLQIPIITGNHIFDIFKIDRFPVPIHGKTNSGQKGYTKLVNTPPYLAIAKNRQYWTVLSVDQYNECDSNHNFCDFLTVVKTINTPNCVAAIFMKHGPDTIKSLCEFKMFTGNTPDYITSVGNARFMIGGQISNQAIICVDGTRTPLKQVNLQVVQISCGCKIVLGNLISNPIAEGCTLNVSSRVQHPLNYALLIAFNYTKYLEGSTINELKDTFPIMPLPDLHKLTTYTARLANTELHLGVDIKEIAKQAATINVDDDIDLIADLDDITADMSISSIGFMTVGCIWGIIITIAIVYLLYHNRMMKTMLISTLPTAQAFAITGAPRIESSLNTQPQQTNQQIVFNLMISATLWAITIYIIYKIVKMICASMPATYRYLQRCCPPPQWNDEFELFLKISNPTTYAIV